MGFYDKPELNVPIASVRMAADVPEAERSKFEVMRTETATYQAAVEAHAMNPMNVLRMAKAMNIEVKNILLVGCEPRRLDCHHELPRASRCWPPAVRASTTSASSPR